MGNVKSLVLAGAAAFGMVPGAFAADLAPVPPPLPRVQAPVEECCNGWYLRGDIGVGAQEFSDFVHHQTNAAFVWPASWIINQTDIKDTTFVGIGLGFQWNSWLRLDATAEFRTSSKAKVIGSFTEFCPGGRCFDVFDFDHQASVFLANVYLDLGTWWCLTPFIGVGAGGARHHVTAAHDIGFIADGTTGFGLSAADQVTWDFAWAVHAGVGFNVSNNLKLEIAYRYLNMGSPDTPIINCQNTPACPGAFFTMTDLVSHDFKIGMRWMLNEPAQPVFAPPPLMRKG
jgi:opacity protein-like surface antigen